MRKLRIYKKLSTKDLALIICFTALYVVLSFWPVSPVIGLFNKTITVATIIAPIIGIILGAYMGGVSAFLGGIVGLFFSPVFSPPSLVAGALAALCAGLLYQGKRGFSAAIYLALLIVFGFYPVVGPVWVYPAVMWFQIVVFLMLISPLQSFALKNLNSNSNSKLLVSFFLICLASTLASQIAGSLTFEIFYDANTVRAAWQGIVFVYPEERIIFALIATFIGIPLLKILKSTNLLQISKQSIEQERCP
jgi:biotin transporter BioY